MGLFSWLFGRGSQSTPEQVARITGPGDFAIEVVGESHYQEALEQLAGPKREQGVNAILEAILLHDDDNPHDPKAIAITIEGEIVGYLPRAAARTFRDKMSEAGAAGVPAACAAVVRGGWVRDDGTEGHYGVWLDLPHE